MKIDYSNILRKNMKNVLRDVLLEVEKNGLQDGHHLYITLNTRDPNFHSPDWVKQQYVEEMTIIIQYEYWNFKVKENSFSICLSFNDIKTDLDISFNSIISFADPFANFGLKLINNIDLNTSIKVEEKEIKKDNVIVFKKFKK